MNGEPAFPVEGKGSTQTVRFWNEGMSLRDWFAGQAISGLIGNDIVVRVFAKQYEPLAVNIAIAAYEIADAMLAEREKSK